jgi:hypothetical protein
MPDNLPPQLGSLSDTPVHASSHYGSYPEKGRVREPKSADHTPAILAYVLTGGFFGLLLLLNFHAPPDANLAILNIVLGGLGTAWLGAMAYFFGATVSRVKDGLKA